MSSSNKPLRNKLVVSLLFTKNSGRNVGRGAKDRNSLRLRVIDEAIRNIFRCYQWVVMDRLPLSLVERKMMRKNASLTPIAKKTLKRYLMRIFKSVEARVAEELPATFGIVLDG
ncbi:hypothetical protein PPTG_24520 [Phytophthora nicotianae INRA-310]|uniref:Transposase n=1 Tax=Phytophthora nicotianae (strain INRA-310) TaxID=761204 RepID=W2PG41_PHYN3|nr:hypothetical protein PPTG_24520 [Phytophthora nicotianae INRA-310]ETM98979.1 hypothetical protein PPTG_24520 [Phytophthora nicotianae INRA-310]